MTPPSPTPTAAAKQPAGGDSLGRNYWRLWGSSSASTFGGGLYVVALPLLGASFTTDPLLLSAVTVAATLPWLLFGLVSGALVDRFDHRRVMVLTDVLRAIAVVILALLLATGYGSILLLIVVAFLLTIGDTFYVTASQSIVPTIVSRARERLQRANSWLATAQILFRDFLGRPLGGALFGVVPWLPVAVNAVSFGTSAGLLATIRDLPARSPTARQPLLREIREGLRWLWAHRLLRALAVAVGVTNLVYTAWSAIVVLMVHQRLGLAGFGFGVLMASLAVGGLAGSWLVTLVSRRWETAPMVWGALLVEGAAVAVLGLGGQVILAGAMLFLIGAVSVGWNVVTVSLRQSIMPPHLYGRVNSAYRLVAVGGAPLGAALGGLMGRSFGLTAPFLFAAVLSLITGLVLARVATARAIETAVTEGTATTEE